MLLLLVDMYKHKTLMNVLENFQEKDGLDWFENFLCYCFPEV